MVVLIDTNVLLDYLTKREPFYADAYKIIELCSSEKIEGYMALHSVSNIFYVLRKAYSNAERRNLLRKLCRILTVVGLGHDRVLEAIERENFADFEDCLQDECAQEISADYIITRNIVDFADAKISAITAKVFLEICGGHESNFL